MAHPTTLPIVAGLSILGAALGVNLGRAAIAEIDPAYFSERPDSFHADLTPNRSPDWAQVQAAEYHQAGFGPPILSCIGCAAYPAQGGDVVYAPAVDGYGDGWAASAAHAREADAGPIVVQPPERDAELERIDRYASYAVSAEEAAEAQPAEEEEALASAGTD